MSTTVPTISTLLAARERIAEHGVVNTPVLNNPQLDALVGCRVWLKAENLQIGGSFKIRGALARLTSLSIAERKHGVVAWSSGNHAAATAIGAARLGTQATIVMPQNAPAVKLANTRRAGAQVVTYDPATQEREALAKGIAAERSAALVPSYDHAEVIAGQGTATLELLDALTAMGVAANTRALLVPAGGGGLAAGANIACQAHAPHIAVIPVEPAGFDDHARSITSGTRARIEPEARTICDALMVPTPGEITFAINRASPFGLVVSDDEVLSAMAFAFRELKLVLEPGGAVALAAFLAGHHRQPLADLATTPPKDIAVLLSGGNVDAELFVRALTEFA